MIDFQLMSSSLATQKCYVSVDSFTNLNCRLGAVARVQTKAKNLVCKVYPHQGLDNLVSICEDTIELYDERQSKILRKQNLTTRSSGSIFTFLPTKVATKVTVTVVAQTFEGVSHLKKCRLSVLIKNLLQNKIFVKFSSVNVEKIAKSMNISKILILDAEPVGEAFFISRKTELVVESVMTKKWCDQQNKISAVQLGGFSSELDKLKELVISPLKNPKTFSRLCTSNGILLHGPSGNGKTEAVHYLCQEFRLSLMPLQCSDLSSSQPGESENKLRAVFMETEMNSQDNPTILFLDEVDSLCPKRGSNPHAQRLLVCLLTLLDEVNHNLPLTIIAASSRPEDIDPALRRPGRLDREICFHMPSQRDRLEILQVHCKDLNKELQVELNEVAEITPGYVGADLRLLCFEASTLSAERNYITLDDFKRATGRIRPSALRHSGSSDFRKVSWEEVGGLQEAQLYLRRSIEWPLKCPEAFTRLKIPRPKGVLIYGPPGCGKSLVVRAAATSFSASFLSASAAELFSPYVGDSEKQIAALFNRARLAVPCILFLDELDALVGSRSASEGRTAQMGVISTLLQEMDGICSSQGVVVVGATNRPDKIDAALLRPGRFDSLVYIPNPNTSSREAILRAVTRKMSIESIDFDQIAAETQLFSGADLEALCKEAAMFALDEDKKSPCVVQRHFMEAVKTMRPSLSIDQVSWYENYASCKRGVGSSK